MTSQNPNNKPIVAVIGGRGKMGNYFASLFREAGLKVLIADKGTKLTNKRAAEQADIVMVSVPIDKTEEVIKEVAPVMKEESVLTDLTSLKVSPVRAMLKAKCEVVGLHPMFSHTNPLPGQTIIACPARGKKWFRWLKEFFEEKGAKITVLKPNEHDRIMAVMQALVHFSDIAFGHALKTLKVPVKKYLEYAGPASELKVAFVGRLLNQDSNLYGNIQLKNPEAMPVLRTYVKSVQALAKMKAEKGMNGFIRYFDDAAKAMSSYKTESFDDTNYLIQALLEKRQLATSVAKTKKQSGKADIALLGPPGTYSDMGSDFFIGLQGMKPQKKAYCKNIGAVFDQVERGNAKIGIVPLENLLQGTVPQTFDELSERNVRVTDKLVLPIHHALVMLRGAKKKEIRTIVTHEQALEQCRMMIKKKLPGRSVQSVESTMAGLRQIMEARDYHTAAIIPLKVAREMNLDILEQEISDYKKNATTFIIIKKGTYTKKSEATKKKAEKEWQTSLVFSFHGDKPGSLYKVLKAFADENINISRIASRPSRLDIGNYLFFLDFEGVPDSERGRTAMAGIRKIAKNFKIIGVYQSHWAE